MAKFQMAGPISEDAVVSRFAEHGIDYKTRADRYQMLSNTMFADADARYYIAYAPTVEEGKPIAVQGIAPYKNIYLLSGLKSHAKESGLEPEQTRGAGSWISNKVIDMHSNKPIVGAANPAGVGVFDKQGFQPIQFDSNNNVINQDDIPDDIREVFTMLENEGSETTAIRKLYYKPVAKWFYKIKKFDPTKQRERLMQRVQGSSQRGIQPEEEKETCQICGSDKFSFNGQMKPMQDGKKVCKLCERRFYSTPSSAA